MGRSNLDLQWCHLVNNVDRNTTARNLHSGKKM